MRLDEETLRRLQRDQKSIIQLMVCDVKRDGEALFFEDAHGELEAQELIEVTLPTAPVVILVGHNTEELHRVYHAQHNKSVLVWISLPTQRCTSKDLDAMAKGKKYKELGEYSVQMDIAYSVLEFFYFSFARHFFSSEHELFLQQVRNSYDLAVAEAMIKTKLRLGFKDEKAIKAVCECIDNNLNFLLGTKYGRELATRPAYSFLCKQKGEEEGEKHERLSQVGRADYELGCNKEVI